MPVFKALSITERKQQTPLTLLDYEEPALEPTEMLIENVAVAQNPVDWKQIDYDWGIPSIPWTNGGDIAGVVYKVGDTVRKFQVGDRIISFLARTSPRHGGFQTYSIASEERTVKLPESVSFEAGAAIPLAYVTASAGFIDALNLSFPPLDELPAKPNDEPILVWGGSSSVGAYAVQIAKLCGFTVLATASPANFTYVKSMGADHVFNYHEADVIDKIRAAAGRKLSRVFDTISEKGSTQNAVKAITAPSGRVAVILPPPADASTQTVEVIQTGSIKAAKNPVTIGVPVYGFLEAALNKGLFKPNKVKIMPGGLLGLNEGLKLGREHKVSGEKLVYRIADTKF